MSEVIDPPVKVAEKRALILMPARMNLAEQLRQDWVVDAEAGTTIEDVLDPQYWSHKAAEMQLYDHIEVRLETVEWIAYLLVVGVGRNFAQVMLREKVDLDGSAVSDSLTAKHEVRFLGPHRKHAVIRLSDSVVLQEGFSKKTEAAAWLVSYENTTSKV